MTIAANKMQFTKLMFALQNTIDRLNAAGVPVGESTAT